MKEKIDLFKGIVGQDTAKRALTDWYYHEDCPVLLYGNSGYGKTLFAKSLGAKAIDTTQMRGDRLNTILRPIKEAEDGDILFFDEIHSLPPKVLEGLYNIIDTGTFYDSELCLDLPLPKVKYIFATNIISPLPIAFKNRCKLIELQDYTEEELILIVHKNVPELNLEAIRPIIKSAKGVPRTTISLAKSIRAGAETEKLDLSDKDNSEDAVNSLLNSRFNINGATGLSEKEFKVVQKVAERGKLSSTAVANVLGCTLHDAKELYIEPLRAAEWLAVSNQGVILGLKGHLHYREFMKKRAV